VAAGCSRKVNERLRTERLRGRFGQGGIAHLPEFACIEVAVIVRPPVCGGKSEGHVA